MIAYKIIVNGTELLNIKGLDQMDVNQKWINQ